MRLPFTKMHGLGNDFVVLDHLEQPQTISPALAALLANRRLGVGCDQVVQLRPASQGAEADMRIYNADGSQAEMCGNAARCVALYLRDRRGMKQAELVLETLAGLVRLYPGVGDQVTVDMGRPQILSQGEQRLASLLPGAEAWGIDDQARIIEVSMGNPHCVVIQPQVERIALEQIGPRLEHHPRYPQRTNVEFVQVLSAQRLRMRVWERGAGITPACGTGACAAAVAAMVAGLTARRVAVVLDGGVLEIEWRTDDHVHMSGPATEVFQGVLIFDPEGV